MQARCTTCAVLTATNFSSAVFDVINRVWFCIIFLVCVHFARIFNLFTVGSVKFISREFISRYFAHRILMLSQCSWNFSCEPAGHLFYSTLLIVFAAIFESFFSLCSLVSALLSHPSIKAWRFRCSTNLSRCVSRSNNNHAASQYRRVLYWFSSAIDFLSSLWLQGSY